MRRPGARAAILDAEGDVGDSDLLASSLGVTRGPVSTAPGMIGDFFGAGYRVRFGNAGQVYDESDAQHPGIEFANGTTVAIAGGDRRFKITTTRQQCKTRTRSTVSTTAAT
jgi:hypothetical protein